MILIADSGSTKTDWCLVDNAQLVQQVFTKGINPFYQTEAEISSELSQSLMPEIDASKVSEIYFYGAGCSFPEKKAMIVNALKLYFPETIIEVESDLLGAARGLFQTNEGIACILGTGSNSCFYNGVEIKDNVSPLGYILGDEGSGAVLSKVFVADCLKNQVSVSLKNKFFSEYELSPATILENVYKKPFPNRYLAQFAKFLSANIAEAEIRKIVFDGFVGFFTRNVKQYTYQSYQVSFVGSVAVHFKEILIEAAQYCDIKMGEIVKSPMMGLIEYHKRNR